MSFNSPENGGKGSKKTEKDGVRGGGILIYLGIFADMEQEKPTVTDNVIRLCRYAAPCGELVIGTIGDRLCLCDWADGARHERTMRSLSGRLCARFAEGETAVATETMRRLDDYFGGRLRGFCLPLLLAGTPFRRRVWEELRRIPYGTTLSYACLARRLGMPQAVRAVASANGDNPLSVIVPCHRVIGSDGSLTGYAGGAERKRWLLSMEGLARFHSPRITRIAQIKKSDESDESAGKLTFP